MDTEKSEIAAMPEGMSSEELDALTTGEEVEKPEVIAQEATTEEKPSLAEESVEKKDEKEVEEVKETVEKKAEEVEEKVDPKDAVIGDFRRRNRDLELEKARLEGELATRKSLQATDEKPKSPLEIAEADYLAQNGTLEGFAMNGELYRQQRNFDDKQAVEKTAKTQEEQAIFTMNKEVDSLQSGDLSPAKVGDGLDFKSVIALGKGYLDKADIMKIEITSHREGIPASVRKTYELCKQAVLAANNEDTKLLQNAISKSQTKPKKETTDIDALTTEDEDKIKGEAENDTPNQRIINFLFG